MQKRWPVVIGLLPVLLMVLAFMFLYLSPEPPNTFPDLLLLASFVVYAGMFVWIFVRGKRSRFEKALGAVQGIGFALVVWAWLIPPWVPGNRRLSWFGFAVVMLTAVVQVGHWFWSRRRIQVATH